MFEETEISVVGSSKFARYQKISAEKTFNMFISDDWLVNYAGYKNVLDIFQDGVGEGRGIFHSIREDFLIVVISSSVFKILPNLTKQFIGLLATTSGDVFIDENLSRQICIVDGQNAYIYSPVTNNLTTQTLAIPLSIDPPINAYNLIPNYVCYHNTFFLLSSSPNGQYPFTWYAFQYATDDTIKFATQFLLQTKPDKALAVKRLPGRGNNVLVLGSTVAEVWTQVGGVENYRRVSSFNIDSGLVSVSTLAASEQYLCYLAQNENNAPFIMMTDGSSSTRISTDGIDNVLSRIVFPAKSTAFFYRQDGHLFYQLTFYDPVDNLSLIYDFNTQAFFHVTDEKLNFHPADQVVFFNEQTYFISLSRASLFRMDTNLTTADYETLPGNYGFEIPRIRICNTVRKKNSDVFRTNSFIFWIEQGMQNPNPSVTPRVDLCFSKDGNQSFSSIAGRELNPVGKFRNQIQWWQMGQANEFTIQLRFYGFTRFVAQNGILTLY